MPRYRKSAEDKPQYCSPSFKKLTPHQVAQNVESGAEVVICCEADEQWSYVQSRGHPRWLFTITFYMTDAWPVYRTLLPSTSHVISKKYTQRIERHNLNLRTHLKRLARRTICFSKSEEMHDKLIGGYLTINHYHSVCVTTLFHND
ncbi:Transposase, IS1 family [Serratia symbiotica SCt-VLC]|uniref:Transposase, IS1 family n=1 Tax=Serratia symbiotica SCt-VLC TaxID=1347341 RepID=A0A068R9L8_9GAMM|nr:Transposase, IS1 family [Serratia symbiotica SCt-VLC]